uniref:hypothetical protein n=1 Tax=Proteus terrae TaxID=1574161 RepID=UPI00301D0DB1
MTPAKRMGSITTPPASYVFSSWFRIGSDFFRKDIHKVIKRMRLDLNGGIEEYEKNAEPPSVEKALRRLRKRGGLLGREL